MIDVVLLGTGALMPTPKRALTSALLTCEGHSILFDCGEGTQSAAARAGISLMKTDIIALTHYHGDHIFGLPGLMQTMSCMGRSNPLIIIGPRGIDRELEPIVKLAGELSYELKLIELPSEGIALKSLISGYRNDARLIPFATEHRVISQCYRFELPRAGKFLPNRAAELNIPVASWSVLQKGGSIELDGRIITSDMVTGPERKGLSVVFSGDTRYCRGLQNAAVRADLLICEATYGENEHEQLAYEHGHMIFKQAAMLAANSEAKRLWLVHYSQMIKEPSDYLDNARRHFINAEVCKDGQSISLIFDD